MENSGSEKKEMSLEENINEIEGIVKQLEQENLTLESAFLLYQNGVEKIRQAEEAIGRVETRMKVLMEDGSLGDME